MFLNSEQNQLFYNKLKKKSNDWQDFINMIENSINLQDIQSWNDFYNYKYIFSLLDKFIAIVKCHPKSLTFNNSIIEEIFIIAEYFTGKYLIDEIKENILSNCGKLLLLTVGITKLENKDNHSTYIYDLRLWTQYNLFQLLNLDSIYKEKDKIINFLNTIHIEKIEKYKKTLMNNINKQSVPITLQFLEQNKDKIFNVNAFNFNKLNKEIPDIISWQENCLLDMLTINISNNQIEPYSNINGIITPDIEQWTPEILNIIKKTVNHEISDFIIDTIGFMKNDTRPSRKVINTHIDLFLENLNQQTNIHIKYKNSSFFTS